MQGKEDPPSPKAPPYQLPLGEGVGVVQVLFQGQAG